MRSVVPGLVLAIAGTASLSTPMTSHAVNAPQITYVQLLNGSGHPRTSFTAGQTVKFKVVVYASGYRAGDLSIDWRVSQGHRTIESHVMYGFHGPTRGHQFNQTGTITLSSHASKGTYTVQALVHCGSTPLSRTERFYVR